MGAMWVLEQAAAPYQPVDAGQVFRFRLVLDTRPDTDLFPAAEYASPAPGCVVATVRWPARSLAAAVGAAVRHAESRGVRVWRVHADDWVTLREIGRRVGRSRETVRRWAAGSHGPPGFPPPLNPGCAVAFHSWDEVRRWLRQALRLDVPGEPAALAAANAALALRRAVAEVPDPTPVWEMLWPD
ncbi:MAG TPA: hypothetical protein VFY17_10695 [Pilimelia sp.]|nr:hypothetical protein [Pilimelia sp.]